MLKMNSLNRIIFAATQMFEIPMSELSFNRIKELLAKKGKQNNEDDKFDLHSKIFCDKLQNINPK